VARASCPEPFLFRGIQLASHSGHFEVEYSVLTIVQTVRSGRSGDCKIFVREVADVIRLRNGDRGESAL
jgi:nitrogen regulatory protein PII